MTDELDNRDHLGLLECLMEQLPIKRVVNIAGWPRPVWLWRLETSQILDLNRKRHLITESEKGAQEWGLELLALCLGDENAPGCFRCANGRSWLRRQVEAMATLLPHALEFNELLGPSEDRKKKLQTLDAPEPYSTSAKASV